MRLGPGPWIQDQTWQECEKPHVGTCRRQQQHLGQSCETHSSAGFSLSLTSALERARLMVFRDSLFSSFWGFGRGRALSGQHGCFRVVPELLLQPAVPRSLAVLQGPEATAVSQPSQDISRGSLVATVSFAVCLTLALLQGTQRARAERGNQGSCLCPSFSYR